MSKVVIIVNPASGSRGAKEFVDTHVIPAITASGATVDKIIETEQSGHHTAAVLADYLRSTNGEVSQVVLASGDGTLGEIVSGLALKAQDQENNEPPSKFKLHIALIPSGTANALYSSLFPTKEGGSLEDPDSKLKSLHSLLNHGKSKPLTLGVTTLSAPPEAKKSPEVAGIACVVVSTALHASILHDSEELRQEHPGIERFKLAAERNAARWATASVKLIPERSGRVEVYDPRTQSFVDSADIDEYADNDIVELEGPFAYFVSTINVDRLEPSFRITPLQSVIPPPPASSELVIIRPDRDPSFAGDTPDGRAAFVPKLWKVLEGAYKDGAHINLRYAPDGSIVEDGDGLPVVEYFRCGGWQWYPVSL